MSYKLKYEIPSVEDYIGIRLAAGLSRKSSEAAEIGLSNTLCGVIVYSGKQPVGIGRVIGDGGCFFEIVDIAVEPAHQKKGLGDMIMDGLMNYINSNAPDTAYVSLMADHGTPEFYKRFGFEASLPPDKSGMSLRINRKT
jgi:ribosomal protein S18 acetylase RimI-like enzyme